MCSPESVGGANLVELLLSPHTEFPIGLSLREFLARDKMRSMGQMLLESLSFAPDEDEWYRSSDKKEFVSNE